MKLDALKYGLAAALTVSIVWLICSILVLILPDMMMSMSGDMVHMNMSRVEWHLSLYGVVVGLVGWAAMFGVFGWLFALIYNRLV